MKEKIIAISLLVSFLSFSTALAVEIPCAFYGTIKVNDTLANGVYVKAYSNNDGKYLATATEPPAGFGHYSIVVNSIGSQIKFKYRNVFVDQPVQNCVSGAGTKLDLTLNCTDCDNDGYNYTVDCDESNSNINPGKTELCNGIDDNCDGVIDNFAESCYTGPAGTLSKGICKAGIRTCTNGAWSNCDGEVLPQTETCNGIDDNCDNSIDEGVCGGGHSTTTVYNGGNNGGSGNSGSGTNNVNTTTVITTTTLVPQTTTSINNTSNTEKIASVTTTIPGTLGMTGLFSSGINSLGYWFILLIIIIILSIIVLIKKINSNKNHPNETSENENSTTTNETKNETQ